MNNEIAQIFEQNRLNDTKKTIQRRNCLNNCNHYMLYFLHLFQTTGILTTTIATSYDKKYLVWVGICITSAATLIGMYEKINNKLLEKSFNNLKETLSEKYIDENILVDIRSSEIKNKNDDAENVDEENV